MQMARSATLAASGRDANLASAKSAALGILALLGVQFGVGIAVNLYTDLAPGGESFGHALSHGGATLDVHAALGGARRPWLVPRARSCTRHWAATGRLRFGDGLRRAHRRVRSWYGLRRRRRRRGVACDGAPHRSCRRLLRRMPATAQQERQPLTSRPP